MKLNKIHIKLHQMGFDTGAYKDYVARLQSLLDCNWKANHTSDYWKYWHKCIVGDFNFTGEYEMAIEEFHLTPREAYDYVFEEFIDK